MDDLFTNVGAKLKAFAKGYFAVSMWILIIGGVISFFVLVSDEPTVPYAVGVLFGVPLAILGNLVLCWMLHAFGSIAEKHENGCVMVEQEASSPVPSQEENVLIDVETPIVADQDLESSAVESIVPEEANASTGDTTTKEDIFVSVAFGVGALAFLILILIILWY